MKKTHLKHHWPLGKESQLFTELRAQPDMQVWRFLPRSRMPPGKTHGTLDISPKRFTKKTALKLLRTIISCAPWGQPTHMLVPPKLGLNPKPLLPRNSLMYGLYMPGSLYKWSSMLAWQFDHFSCPFFWVQTPVYRLRRLRLCLAGHSC